MTGPSQQAHDALRPDAAEIEPLQSAHHRSGRVGDLLRLGGGENEDDPRRRLLENLEQRVPRFPREHVGFVDDVDLVASRAAGGVHRAFPQLARVVDTPIARRVDLHDVEIGAAGPDALTRFALPARLAVVPARLAVQRHGQDTGGTRLPDAARARQQVSVRHAIAGDGPGQPRSDVRLSDEVFEPSWTVLPGESGVDHGLEVPQAPRSDTRHRLALLPSRS